MKERMKIGITPVAMRLIGSDDSYAGSFAAGAAQTQ